MDEKPTLPRLNAYLEHALPQEVHPSADEFFHAIGKLVYHWGQLEQQINVLQHIAVRVLSRFGQTEELQHSLSRKTRLIKSIYQRIPEISWALPVVTDSMEKVRVLGDRRNDIVHSAIEGIQQSNPPQLLLRRYKVTKDVPETILLKMTVMDIDQLTKEIDGEAADHLFVLTAILATYQDHSEKSGKDRLRELQEAFQIVPKQE